jgi:hypothetical protein
LGDLRVPEPNRVYVPLQVWDLSGKEPQGVYTVVIVPSAQLKELYVSVGELRSDRTLDHWVYQHHRVPRVMYARDAPISISLPPLQGRLFRVSLGAETAGGVPVTLKFDAQTP